MSVTRVVAVALYAVAFAVAVVIEVAARRPGARLPSLAVLCGSIMRYRAGNVPVGRLAVLGFWWWLGWHLLAR